VRRVAFVTCICPTTSKRAKWLPRAIRYFRSQTYPHKKLLLIQDDGDDLLRFADEDIDVSIVSRCASLGIKRNAAVSIASGDIIAHWDDDDWNHPDRLQLQVRALVESGRSVTGFRRMHFWDGAVCRMYSGAPNYAIGTSLCYRRQWAITHPFRSLNIGEDNEFVRDAQKHGELSVTDGLGLMVAWTHRNGTSPRNYATNWTVMSEKDLPEEFKYEARPVQ
jgi:O-antigen biosynthesis protein